MGRVVQLPTFPKRIISLVPSQTELLAYLGLKDRIVGITKFCIHPNEIYCSKSRVGGTKQYNFEQIKLLKPDLIIGNKEENDQEQIEALAKEYPVWISDVTNLDSALEMIASIGEITQTKDTSEELIAQIKTKFEELPSKQLNVNNSVYLIWRKPWMTVGNDTFINHIMQRAGFENIHADKTRYPILADEELSSSNPDVLLLSSEPFPFKEKHIKELQDLCPKAKIMLVDGELFSWYGSRLLKTPGYLLELNQQFRS